MLSGLGLGVKPREHPVETDVAIPAGWRDARVAREARKEGTEWVNDGSK